LINEWTAKKAATPDVELTSGIGDDKCVKCKDNERKNLNTGKCIACVGTEIFKIDSLTPEGRCQTTCGANAKFSVRKGIKKCWCVDGYGYRNKIGVCLKFRVNENEWKDMSKINDYLLKCRSESIDYNSVIYPNLVYVPPSPKLLNGGCFNCGYGYVPDLST